MHSTFTDLQRLPADYFWWKPLFQTHLTGTIAHHLTRVLGEIVQCILCLLWWLHNTANSFAISFRPLTIRNFATAEGHCIWIWSILQTPNFTAFGRTFPCIKDTDKWESQVASWWWKEEAGDWRKSQQFRSSVSSVMCRNCRTMGPSYPKWILQEQLPQRHFVLGVCHFVLHWLEAVVQLLMTSARCRQVFGNLKGGEPMPREDVAGWWAYPALP